MEISTYERILGDTQDLQLVLDLAIARASLSHIKVKIRHLDKKHPKHIPFSEDVAKRCGIELELIGIVSTEMHSYECARSLGGLGGSDENRSWLKLMERIEKYRKEQHG